MNHPEPHPIELAIVAAMVVAEALAVLLVAAAALLLTVARWRPAPPPAPPIVHPLALVAQQLEALPVAALRPMVGTRSKRIRKTELVAMLAAC